MIEFKNVMFRGSDVLPGAWSRVSVGTLRFTDTLIAFQVGNLSIDRVWQWETTHVSITEQILVRRIFKPRKQLVITLSVAHTEAVFNKQKDPSKRVRVLSDAQADLVFHAKEDPATRAALAQRILESCPAAAGRVTAGPDSAP